MYFCAKRTSKCSKLSSGVFIGAIGFLPRPSISLIIDQCRCLAMLFANTPPVLNGGYVHLHTWRRGSAQEHLRKRSSKPPKLSSITCRWCKRLALHSLYCLCSKQLVGGAFGCGLSWSHVQAVLAVVYSSLDLSIFSEVRSHCRNFSKVSKRRWVPDDNLQSNFVQSLGGLTSVRADKL